MTDGKLKTLLRVVDDGDCRAILDAIDEDAKAVKELSDECDIPLSTAYRKINRLQEAELVEEHIRVNGSGNHENVYERSFDGAFITITNEGDFEVEFVTSVPPTETRETAEKRSGGVIVT